MRGAFTLTIRLGGDAMRDSGAVADALHDLANHLPAHGLNDKGSILDRNGNAVGAWRLAARSVDHRPLEARS